MATLSQSSFLCFLPSFATCTSYPDPMLFGLVILGLYRNQPHTVCILSMAQFCDSIWSTLQAYLEHGSKKEFYSLVNAGDSLTASSTTLQKLPNSYRKSKDALSTQQLGKKLKCMNQDHAFMTKHNLSTYNHTQTATP